MPREERGRANAGADVLRQVLVSANKLARRGSHTAANKTPRNVRPAMGHHDGRGRFILFIGIYPGPERRALGQSGRSLPPEARAPTRRAGLAWPGEATPPASHFSCSEVLRTRPLRQDSTESKHILQGTSENGTAGR